MRRGRDRDPAAARDRADELAPPGRRPGRRPGLPARHAAAADAGAGRRDWPTSRSTWPRPPPRGEPFTMHLAGTGTFRPTVAGGVHPGRDRGRRTASCSSAHPQRPARPRARVPVPPARDGGPGHRRRRRSTRPTTAWPASSPASRSSSFVLFSRDGDGAWHWRTRVPARARCRAAGIG